MGDQNPWVVENIEAFSFYCCPECDFKSKDEDYFKRHAMESHNKSKIFLTMSKSKMTPILILWKLLQSLSATHCSRIDLYKILFPGTFFTFPHSYIMGTI